MLGMRRCIHQISLSHYRAFSSVKFADVTLGGNLLRNASFQIEKGEKVALLGDNARTKTAIVQAISGEVEPVSGDINRGDKVLTYQPRHSYKDQMQTIAQYLKNSSGTALSDDVVKKILENVKLGDVRSARSLGGLTPSQQARVQLAAILLRSPDIIIFNDPTHENNELTHDDVEDLKEFISAYKNTCIINSGDEDFVASVSSAVLVLDEVMAGEGGAKILRENYHAVKSKLSVYKRQKHFAATAAVREASATKHAFLHDDDTDRALNELGFQNQSAAVSQEEYIRVMMLIMAAHPPILLFMYSVGLFDAII